VVAHKAMFLLDCAEVTQANASYFFLCYTLCICPGWPS